MGICTGDAADNALEAGLHGCAFLTSSLQLRDLQPSTFARITSIRVERGFALTTVRVRSTVDLLSVETKGSVEMSREKRFDELRKIPPHAAVDHRFFLDEDGRDRRLKELSRNERRKLKAESVRLSRLYGEIMLSIRKSGAGYPVDQLLRDLAIEYTHRYASSGVFNQPASFNYFEAFCALKLIESSVAPYAEPLQEIDHLFNVADYFDYLTDENAPMFDIADLKSIDEGRIYHFSQNGSINDFTYMTAEGREFVISGFSMVRRGNSIHWFLLGGEVLSEAEWLDKSENQLELEIEHTAIEKRPFLSESMREKGNRSGAPVALQGTKTAVRTVIAGEIDLTTSKHVARCHMSEMENSFSLFCDDPEIFSNIPEPSKREEVLAEMQRRIESAGVMWDLAEGFLRLIGYFQCRITVSEDVVKASARPAPKTAKGGRGVGAQFKYVTSIEVSDVKPTVMRSYTPPHFEVETEGYWRRIPDKSFGWDREGNPIQGRTWVKATNNWRARTEQRRTVYIKSSVKAAKIQVSDYLAAAERVDGEKRQTSEQTGVLYVMRCLAMNEQVYKVGWTSNSAEQRAKELSTATGVPVSFAVVEVWQHPDPEALEKGVHAMLGPYRLNESREFFKLNYPELKSIIEAEIARTERH